MSAKLENASKYGVFGQRVAGYTPFRLDSYLRLALHLLLDEGRCRPPLQEETNDNDLRSNSKINAISDSTVAIKTTLAPLEKKRFAVGGLAERSVAVSQSFQE